MYSSQLPRCWCKLNIFLFFWYSFCLLSLKLVLNIFLFSHFSVSSQSKQLNSCVVYKRWRSLASFLRPGRQKFPIFVWESNGKKPQPLARLTLVLMEKKKRAESVDWLAVWLFTGRSFGFSRYLFARNCIWWEMKKQSCISWAITLKLN